MKKASYLALLIVALSGCTLARVEVSVVSERTALENQVLGSYNALTQDVLLVASVRGVDPSGAIKTPPEKSREHQNAVEAVETLAFHEDDVDAFKRLGWVGEDNEGRLAPFPLQRDTVPDELKAFADRYHQAEFDSVVVQVNKARDVVMQRVVETNPDLTDKDMPQIRSIFARLNRENALSGEKIQQEDGSWTVKQ
jgi:uncharacterized protein YdbL (DUF1318 family)